MMYGRILDDVVGFRDGRWLDDDPARETLGIVARHIVSEIDKRIAREQMGGGFGVVVDSLESLREWIWNDPLTLEWRAKLDAGERGESR